MTKKKQDQEMISETQVLTIQCPEGHKFSRSFLEFQNDQSCPVCAVIKQLESEGHTLISDEECK